MVASIFLENVEAWHPIPESGLTRAEYGFELRESIQETTGIGLPSPICSAWFSFVNGPMLDQSQPRKYLSQKIADTAAKIQVHFRTRIKKSDPS